MRRFRIAAVLVALPLMAGRPVLADPGSGGCAVITQAAATGAQNRVAADSQTIQQPKSIKSLTCLDNILNGVGLNLITNLLDPATLLNSIEGQICSAITNEWNSLVGGASCGLTVTGFSLGIGGLGGGLSCPKLTFGGGGPTLGTFGLGAGGSSVGLYLNGIGRTPTGFTLPSTPKGSF